MKVLLVDQIGNKNYEYDYSVAKHFSDDVEITCYMSDDTPKDVKHDGFEVVYGFKNVYSGRKVEKGIKLVRALSDLKRYIKKQHFDIVQLQWFDLPLYQSFFIKSLKKLYKPGPKIVLTAHGIYPPSAGKRRYMGLRRVYQEADAVFVHTEDGLKSFNEFYPTSCPKYMITSAFRDADDYQPIDKKEARKILGLPEDKTIILNFGTIRGDKGVDLLFKAFPKALITNPNLFLLSGGTLNVKDKEYYRSLAAECEKTGSARIEFDYIDKKLEPAYYSAADILVVPYTFVSQSGVAFCGLLYHLPMIASDIPRLDLMAKRAINADIFSSGNVEELAKAIVELSSDPERMGKYSQGSLQVLNEDFSIERRAMISENAYRELLS